MVFSTILRYLSSLLPQAPVLITLAIGTVICMRQPLPAARFARHVSWAFAILLLDSLLITGVAAFLPDMMVNREATAPEITWAFAILQFVSSSIQAVAFIIILLGFLGPDGSRMVARRLAPWLGGLLGLLLGGALAMLLGDAIGSALGISNFEGARGYFVVLAVIPLFSLAGAIIGFIAGRMAAIQR